MPGRAPTSNLHIANLLATGCCALLMVLSQAALASDDFYFTGFATLAAGKVSENHLFLGDYQDNWSADSDTRIGVQGIYRVTDGLSVTGQVVVRGHTYGKESEYEPTISWLFGSYSLSSTAQIRFGRMRTPHYLYSDSLEVGYSYLWVRPPIDVYTPLFEPFSNFTGIDFSDSLDVSFSSLDSDAELTYQFFVGTNENEFIDFEIDGRKLLGANISMVFNEWQYRYSLVAMEVNATNPRFQRIINEFTQLAAIDPLFQRAAEQWSLFKGHYYYHEVGVQWETLNWKVTGEAYYIQDPDEGFSSQAKGWYVSIARRFGKFTPYLVKGWYAAETGPQVAQAVRDTYAAIPFGADPGLEALRETAIQTAGLFDVKEYTTTLGLRYDLMKNVALKGEWQHFTFRDDSTGHMFYNFEGEQPKNASLLTFSVDVVF